MAKQARIPTPLAQHFRRFRFQVLPIMVFIGVVALTSSLWTHQRNRQWGSGEVDETAVDLSFNIDGTLIPVALAPQLMDTVRAGDVVAQLDPRPIAEELAAMRADLDRLRAELEALSAQFTADGADRQFDRVLATRRLSLDVERHQLDILDRQAQLETDRIELLQMELDFTTIEAAFAQGVETEYNVENFRLRRDAARQRVQGREVALAETKTQLEVLRKRQAEHAATAMPDAELQTAVAPIHHAIKVQEARVRALELQREALSIVSPIDGMITAVHYQPGQAIRRGVPVVKVTSIHAGDVISYLREGHDYRPNVGEEVLVRSRSGRRIIFKGTVENVGPEYERIPTHQLRDPQRPEWGLSIRITLGPDSDLLPGELVDITYARHE